MTEDIEEVYQALINLGFTEDELNKEINARFREYQGFMSRAAILFLLAKELHLYNHDHENFLSSYDELEDETDYNEFLLPIAQISEGMSNIVIVGRIISISQIREFIRKDGSSDIVGYFHIADSSGNIKVVLWSDQAKIIDHEFFTFGQVVQVIGGYVKKGLNDELEIHISKRGKVVLSPKDIDMKHIPEVEDIRSLKVVNNSIHIQDLYDKEGFIPVVAGMVELEDLRMITLKDGNKTFLLKFKLCDETSSIMVNIWGMDAPEFIKNVSEGERITLSNVLIKESPYSNEKELNLTKNSIISS